MPARTFHCGSLSMSMIQSMPAVLSSVNSTYRIACAPPERKLLRPVRGTTLKTHGRARTALAMLVSRWLTSQSFWKRLLAGSAVISHAPVWDDQIQYDSQHPAYGP